ncbi:hypothetical protein CMU89_18735 [Elizabethkingia anophelis]|uniref:FISUMP domain-containing protein n=1 Tax=Elizabethkingia anophelis TaxID=1117645 RepID=UPI000C6DF66A|nr:FISUMP domain-containing protein [Elizabethkingia anophelis]MDV3509031.1 hypothetical protein [Elizabethkingia anophelis]MDV3544664.1 hypothetical protein [Elizabethkingia anophelis]PKR31539.1 hypothetical protein CWH99_12295 [Elizabethkingia anophelis]PKR34774.1 hypothetical protein CWI00_08765 [Elizabethkingia anophelis]PRQ78243.1 hypothetical protein CMT60_19055 [Elizabethkingia anophelis]
MKRRIQKSTGASILLSILLLSSCRSTDTENNLAGNGISVVNFNLMGSAYSDSGELAGQASLTKENLSNYENQVQRNNILITPSSIVITELSPLKESLKVASSGLNSIAAIPGNSITSGMKFRVIAYRQSNGNYHTHEDYTVGQPAAPMMLDNGAAYNIIVYSYGAASLPLISSGEQNNLSSAIVNYDDTNRDFMYQKIPFTPTNSTNTLNITLRHKVAQITAIVNSVGLGNITNITGGLLTPHYSNGIVSLASGTMSERTILSKGTALNFSDFNTTTSTSAPVFINADTAGNNAGGFSAAITIGGTTKTFNLSNSFKITPENKSNLTIKIAKCGAYIGPNTNPANFKEFMCHNLGATTSADPFTPAAAVHGAKYQWGAQTGEARRYVSQYDDQNGGNPLWNTSVKGNNSWSDTSKTSNDPCPSGYRVPTNAQWQAVLANNNMERIGPWSYNSYNSAIYFRNPSNVRTLMLPVTGYRDQFGGKINQRGLSGQYWSASESSSGAAYFLRFTNWDIEMGDYNRANAFSVRCISMGN